MILKNTRKLPVRSRAKGFSLIEVLIVIGIIAVVGYLIFARSNEVRSGVSAQQESEFIVGIIPTIDRMRDVNAGFDGVTQETLIDSGFLDKSFVRGTTLVTPSQLPVTAASVATWRNVPNNALELTIAGYPQATCNDLGTRAARIAKIERITLNGTVVHDVPAGTIATTAVVTGACVAEDNEVALLVK